MAWKNALEKLDLDQVLKRFAKARVLVIGDLILDHFIWGKAERISPEAPVPVVEVERESRLMGGAANVAHNIRTLGGRVEVCGLLGEDEAGRELLSMLRDVGISVSGVIVDGKRPTTVKTRVIASGQQVVRFDREKRDGIPKEEQDRLRSLIRELWEEMDCVLISDYGKGMITRGIMEEVVKLKGEKPKTVVVDPKIGHFPLYKGVTIMTPNTKEAEAAAGMVIRTLDDLKVAGRKILKRFALDALLITRGEEGMALFLPRKQMVPIPTVAKEVYDVTGAGDTVAAVLSLGLASGLDFLQAAALANCAAGVVVGKLGTAVVTPDELREAVQRHRKGLPAIPSNPKSKRSPER